MSESKDVWGFGWSSATMFRVASWCCALSVGNGVYAAAHEPTWLSAALFGLAALNAMSAIAAAIMWAKEAFDTRKDDIRAGVEQEVWDDVRDELDAINDDLCRERARSAAYSDLLDDVLPEPTKEQMDKLGESTERYYQTEKAILADREKEAKP